MYSVKVHMANVVSFGTILLIYLRLLSSYIIRTEEENTFLNDNQQITAAIVIK